MKLYCDTTLLNNSTDEPAEREAVASLLAAHRKDVVVLYGSDVNRREVGDTQGPR